MIKRICFLNKVIFHQLDIEGLNNKFKLISDN